MTYSKLQGKNPFSNSSENMNPEGINNYSELKASDLNHKKMGKNISEIDLANQKSINSHQAGTLLDQNKNQLDNFSNLNNEHKFEQNIIVQNSRLNNSTFVQNKNNEFKEESKEFKYERNKNEAPIQYNNNNDIINLKDLNNLKKQKVITQNRKIDIFSQPTRLSKILQDEMLELFNESGNNTNVNRFEDSELFENLNLDEKKKIVISKHQKKNSGNYTENSINPDKYFAYDNRKESQKNQKQESCKLNSDIINEIPINNFQKGYADNYSKKEYINNLNNSNNIDTRLENKSNHPTNSSLQQNETKQKVVGKNKNKNDYEYQKIVNEFNSLTSKK